MAGEKKGLQLLDFWVSPFGQRCRIALDEKALPYEYLEQDLGNKSELLLRSNPMHKRPRCSSTTAAPSTSPSSSCSTSTRPSPPPARSRCSPPTRTRAQARLWADYVDREVYDCGTRLSKVKGEPLVQARKEMVEILKTFEGALGGKPYFGGDEFGFLDVAFVPFTPWFLSYERLGEFSVEKECPKLAAWAKRCGERESVKKNLHPLEGHGPYGALKKKYGALKKKYSALKKQHGALKQKYGVE